MDNVQNVWVPVIAGFLAFTIAVGTFCRWRGMRRRRQLDVLERLEREADDIEERFVEYRENPTMFDASLGQSRSCSGRWSSVMVSVLKLSLSESAGLISPLNFSPFRPRITSTQSLSPNQPHQLTGCYPDSSPSKWLSFNVRSKGSEKG